MPKLFSVASWNVEHFKDDPTGQRIARVVDFVKAQDPDVFGIYEVEGATVFDALVTQMPNYTFQITEGVETQEILIGVKKTVIGIRLNRWPSRRRRAHQSPKAPPARLPAMPEAIAITPAANAASA